MNDGSHMSVSCKYDGVDWGDGINECLNRPCDTNATCTDKIDGFVCTCLHGYTGDGFTCIQIPDIDECTLNTHNCSENARCIDTLESYVCICKDGFVDVQGDGRECTPQETCCKKFHLGVEPPMAQYTAMCEYVRDHSMGFMEYRCNKEDVKIVTSRAELDESKARSCEFKKYNNLTMIFDHCSVKIELFYNQSRFLANTVCRSEISATNYKNRIFAKN